MPRQPPPSLTPTPPQVPAGWLYVGGRYLIGNLQSLSPSELSELAVAERWTEADLQALPLPERYIVSRAHELVAKVTAGLESYEMVRRRTSPRHHGSQQAA